MPRFFYIIDRMESFLCCLCSWTILPTFFQETKENGLPLNSELALFQSHLLQQNSTANLLLRHHQEQQIKFQQQQQMLHQWFQKEEEQQITTQQQQQQLRHEQNFEPLLLKDGTCQWPGCEKSRFSDGSSFQQHLNSQHSLSQSSAAQVPYYLF